MSKLYNIFMKEKSELKQFILDEFLQRLQDNDRLNQQEYQSLVQYSHLMKPRERDVVLNYFFQQEQFDALKPKKVYNLYKQLTSPNYHFVQYAEYAGWLVKCQQCFKRHWTDLDTEQQADLIHYHRRVPIYDVQLLGLLLNAYVQKTPAYEQLSNGHKQSGFELSTGPLELRVNEIPEVEALFNELRVRYF